MPKFYSFVLSSDFDEQNSFEKIKRRNLNEDEWGSKEKHSKGDSKRKKVEKRLAKREQEQDRF